MNTQEGNNIMEDMKKVKMLAKAGLDPDKIAETLDLDLADVQTILSIKRKRPELSIPEQDKLAIEKKKELQDRKNKMRLLREQGHSIYKIAAAFGTQASMVQFHTKDVKPKVINKRSEKSVLTDDDIDDLKFMKKNDFSNDQIARFLKTTEVCVLTYSKKLKL